MPDTRVPVLIAGIGGASLGTELLKCLAGSTRFAAFGCDVHPLAYGHYQGDHNGSYLVDRHRYVDSVLELCARLGARAVIPGGEEPLALLSQAAGRLNSAKVHLASNAADVVSLCGDKARLFARLRDLGIPVPWTMAALDVQHTTDIPVPCVIKPATGTGGSTWVFLAHSREEVAEYAAFLGRNGKIALLQEYVPEDEGEFTIGVLSLTDGTPAGSIALRRTFHAKLSVSLRTPHGVVSSGYSQGLIDDFPDVRSQAERIASQLGSRGPMNIQGRLKGGVLLPFEINARFSASTWLRALAGFNEVEAYLAHLFDGLRPEFGPLRAGYYLRSLSEVYVPQERVIR